MITTTLLGILSVCVAFVCYTYAGYPAILKLLASRRVERRRPDPPVNWPRISITLAAYNEEATIRYTVHYSW